MGRKIFLMPKDSANVEEGRGAGYGRNNSKVNTAEIQLRVVPENNMFVHVGKDIVVYGIGQFYILRYVGNFTFGQC